MLDLTESPLAERSILVVSARRGGSRRAAPAGGAARPPAAQGADPDTPGREHRRSRSGSGGPERTPRWAHRPWSVDTGSGVRVASTGSGHRPDGDRTGRRPHPCRRLAGTAGRCRLLGGVLADAPATSRSSSRRHDAARAGARPVRRRRARLDRRRACRLDRRRSRRPTRCSPGRGKARADATPVASSRAPRWRSSAPSGSPPSLCSSNPARRRSWPRPSGLASSSSGSPIAGGRTASDRRAQPSPRKPRQPSCSSGAAFAPADSPLRRA